MGLTIAYSLSTRRRLPIADVRVLVARLHAKARSLGFAKLGKPFAVGPEYTWAYYWPRGVKRLSDLRPPAEGWIFDALPGDGCENASMGLCRYEGVAGWRLRSFCKTQYAARNGWEHFRDCHRRVIELLWAAEDLGLRVKVTDEGGLWDTGSEALLRRRIEEHDRAIAAFGGALKDAAGDRDHPIQGPIFEDPRFERLEAEGQADLPAPLRHCFQHGSEWLP